MATSLTKPNIRGISFLSLMLFSFAFPALGAPSKGTTSTCERIFAWVDANLATLPRTYDEIANLHPAYRRAIYTVLSPEEKSDLWRIQFKRFLASEPRMTKTQRALLGEAVRFSTPQNFAVLTEPGRVEYNDLSRYLDGFEARAKGAFGTERSRAIFGMLGPASIEDIFFSVPTAPGEPDPSPNPPPSTTACSCSRSGNDCPNGEYACTAKDPCERIKNGCGGVIFKNDCDGLCQKPTPAPVDSSPLQ